MYDPARQVLVLTFLPGTIPRRLDRLPLTRMPVDFTTPLPPTDAPQAEFAMVREGREHIFLLRLDCGEVVMEYRQTVPALSRLTAKDTAFFGQLVEGIGRVLGGHLPLEEMLAGMLEHHPVSPEAELVATAVPGLRQLMAQAGNRVVVPELYDWALRRGARVRGRLVEWLLEATAPFPRAFTRDYKRAWAERLQEQLSAMVRENPGDGGLRLQLALARSRACPDADCRRFVEPWLNLPSSSRMHQDWVREIEDNLAESPFPVLEKAVRDPSCNLFSVSFTEVQGGEAHLPLHWDIRGSNLTYGEVHFSAGEARLELLSGRRLFGFDELSAVEQVKRTRAGDDKDHISVRLRFLGKRGPRLELATVYSFDYRYAPDVAYDEMIDARCAELAALCGHKLVRRR